MWRALEQRPLHFQSLSKTIAHRSSRMAQGCDPNDDVSIDQGFCSGSGIASR
jgi:hypothetical protein